MAADMRTRPGVARHGTDVAAGGTVPTRRGRAVVTNSKTLTIQKVIIITLQDLSCGLKKNPKLATLPPIESNRFHSKAVFIFRHNYHFKILTLFFLLFFRICYDDDVKVIVLP